MPKRLECTVYYNATFLWQRAIVGSWRKKSSKEAASRKVVQGVLDQIIDNATKRTKKQPSKKPTKIIIQEVDHISDKEDDDDTIVVFTNIDRSATGLCVADAPIVFSRLEARTIALDILNQVVDLSVLVSEEHRYITEEMQELDELLEVSISTAESHLNELVCRGLVLEFADNAVSSSETKAHWIILPLSCH